MPGIELDDVRPTSFDGVRERLPEIHGTRGAVQSELVRVFAEDVPPEFWVVRASASHHPPDERGLGGLWLHTKRVFTAYRMLEPTFRATSAISAFEANCARAAVLLHDAFKYGRDPASTTIEADDADGHDYADGILDHVPAYTDRGHDVAMGEYVRIETEMPDEVARCIECHGGPVDWYGHEGPGPSDDLTLLVHLSDLVASNSEHRLPVHGIHDVLGRMVGDAPAVSDEMIESVDDF